MCKIELSKEHDMAQFWPSGLILQTIFKLICNIKYSTRPASHCFEDSNCTGKYYPHVNPTFDGSKISVSQNALNCMKRMMAL